MALTPGSDLLPGCLAEVPGPWRGLGDGSRGQERCTPGAVLPRAGRVGAAQGRGRSGGHPEAPAPASPKPFTCRRASASASSMARSGHAASPAPSAPSPAAAPRLSQTSRDRRPLLPGSAASGAGTQRRRSAAPGRLPGLRSRTRGLWLPLRRRRSGTGGRAGASRAAGPGRSPRAQRGGSERPAPPADRGRCRGRSLRAGHLLPRPRQARPRPQRLPPRPSVSKGPTPTLWPPGLGASSSFRTEQREASPGDAEANLRAMDQNVSVPGPGGGWPVEGTQVPYCQACGCQPLPGVVLACTCAKGASPRSDQCGKSETGGHGQYWDFSPEASPTAKATCFIGDKPAFQSEAGPDTY